MKLVRIDLTKSKYKGIGSDHPDFNEESYYLAVISGNLYFGQFTKQWYGWNFDDGWGCSGHQFDAPGHNSSKWQALYEVKGTYRMRGGS
jgi:hypothetical protein